MKLLTAALRAKMPALYSQEHIKLNEKIVHAKFFFPAGNWTWFITEGEQDGDDFRMFGFVIGFEKEWVIFRLMSLSQSTKRASPSREIYILIPVSSTT